MSEQITLIACRSAEALASCPTPVPQARSTIRETPVAAPRDTALRITRHLSSDTYPINLRKTTPLWPVLIQPIAIPSHCATMSAPPSPKPSFESEERPESSQSMSQTAGASHKRNISFEDKTRSYSPRRRSIQFQVAAAESQLPSRPLEKRVSYGDTSPKELEAERDQRSAQAGRGPSPPPPKCVFL